ncbi:hypothetical protein D9757_000857 [Collybiopsis confluens]|uniref:Uncharacterized protein n=1 Tax=Collybiopsis confluens TaxID=2823264 RepID=A0A8H5MG36_9AGAR|nr:hypothetical protein D9757_000857 [Collybiopsis confluens]
MSYQMYPLTLPQALEAARSDSFQDLRPEFLVMQELTAGKAPDVCSQSGSGERHENVPPASRTEFSCNSWNWFWEDPYHGSVDVAGEDDLEKDLYHNIGIKEATVIMAGLKSTHSFKSTDPNAINQDTLRAKEFWQLHIHKGQTNTLQDGTARHLFCVAMNRNLTSCYQISKGLG